MKALPPVVRAIICIVAGSGGTGILFTKAPKPNVTLPFGVPSETA